MGHLRQQRGTARCAQARDPAIGAGLGDLRASTESRVLWSERGRQEGQRGRGQREAMLALKVRDNWLQQQSG